MTVGLDKLPSLSAVRGVRLGVASAGIKQANRPDLVVVSIDEGSRVAAVFTRNAFCAAPVTLAKNHLATAAPRYFLVNTGNANAGTGAPGLQDASTCCHALSDLVGCRPNEVLPFSTGVIGEPLPVERIVAGLPQALAHLSAEGWAEAARGIMTTDSVPKGSSGQAVIGGHTVTVTGIAKGAGMIRPDMATMLAFIATDAAVAPGLLQRCLVDAVERSFNRITVDGDTSTNDACVLVATGAAGAPQIERADAPEYEQLARAVTKVCETLAQSIVRDGEGATKFITVEICGGADQAECLAVAYTVAQSPLVKTAFFASDPNWGRILAAVGRAGVPDLDLKAVTIHLGDLCIVRDGGRAPEYKEARGQAVMDREEIAVRVDLARGEATDRVWTCDLSYEYVRINAEYRT